jgi:excisionase family DNA binding protein
MQQLVTEVQLASRLGVSPRTLQAQRVRGGGIPFIKLGRSVRYDISEVDRHLTAQRRVSTSDKT